MPNVTRYKDKNGTPIHEGDVMKMKYSNFFFKCVPRPSTEEPEEYVFHMYSKFTGKKVNGDEYIKFIEDSLDKYEITAIYPIFID